MLTYLRDTLHAARLKARYRRIVQERLLNLVEGSGPYAVADDPGNWIPLGDGKPAVSEVDRVDLRDKARELVATNPHAHNVLRLLEVYVVGPGLQLGHVPIAQSDPDAGSVRVAEVRVADAMWREFLAANAKHFSYREFARRTWRDGECFLRLFPNVGDAASVGVPAVRFVDPETIAGPPEWPDSRGILTADGDVETPVAYLRVDPVTGKLRERIPAAEMLHARINVDSNQKRGLSFFAPLVESLSRFDKWLDTELAARRLQASIVLWRRIQGSPSQVAGFADGLDTGAFPSTVNGSTVRSERYRPGTILTTSQGTELKFLQPDTNFGDAVTLGRQLLLSAASGAGLPEFMLTADASNANYASTMVAEGPAVKLFQSEQQFFAGEFERLWRMVMSEAIAAGRLPDDFFEQIRPQWTFPKLVARDRPREREADVKLVESRVLSRAEIARRDGADPEQMRRELAEEK
jgi:capsid protein